MHNRISFKKYELERISIDHHDLGATFCRQTLQNGGVSISVHESLSYTTLQEITRNGKQQNTEVCAVKLNLPTTGICKIFIYISPTANLHAFFLRA